MLSGEGNENCEKTIIGLISKKKKKQLCTSSTLFWYISLPLFCTITRNVQKLPGYTFYGGNVVHVLVHFFHCCLFFLRWVLAFRIFSPPLQIRVVLLLISRSCSPSLFSSLGFAGLSPFFSCSLSFRSLCIPNLWACQLI